MTPIVPALIPKDEYEVIKAAGDLTFSREFHLDIVDEEFAGKSSWPIAPAGDPVAIGHALRGYSLEVDLMVAGPAKLARQFLEAGADRIVFHIETISLEAFESFTAESTASVGVSFHGATPFDTFIEYIPYADFVQLMGIREIGMQGQPFYERVLEYIPLITREFPGLSITVDGSVNPETIKRLHDSGVDRFVVGSAIVGQDDPEQAWRELHSLINPILL